MANSLRNKIKHFCYTGELSESERDRLLNALDDADRINSELKPCEDCISRQAVIDINEYHHGQMPNHVNHEIWKEIKALPSVTPQPKVGKWIDVDSLDGALWHECSECGETEFYATDYCPYCGCQNIVGILEKVNVRDIEEQSQGGEE